MPIYIVLSGDAVNFTLHIYTVLDGGAVNFDLSEVQGNAIFFGTNF